MSEKIGRRPGESTASSRALSSRSGFEQLAPELQAGANRRLSGVALIYAGTYAFFFLLGWALELRQTQALCVPESSFFVRATVSIGMALVVHVLAKKGRIPPRDFLNVALVFEVLGAYGMAGGNWGWPIRVDRFLQIVADSGADVSSLQNLGIYLFGDSLAEGGMITWSSIWVLIFPLVVPMPLRRAVLASFLTASVMPAVQLSSQLFHGVTDLVRPAVPALWAAYLVPSYIVAGMASFGCVVTYRLQRELTKARELGAYRLVECIGRGGMGEVWRAKHRMLVRPAAVKLIRPEAIGGPAGGGGTPGTTIQRRFEREAQATAALASPHTIEVYDFGISADGTFYYVMELLDGVDLKTLVDRYGSQPPARVVAILKQACHSLADAHATGLVHRDVKPANLFVCRRGLDFDFVKVLDFGLVKDAGNRDAGGEQLTVEGVASGTPAFMAPEMAMGRSDVDGRADLYALGCVAYWLLTGRLVFEGETAMAILLAHAKDEPTPPSKRSEIAIPEALERLVMELLSKSPDGRPPDALAVLQRLEAMEPEIGAWTAERAARWWHHHRPEPTRWGEDEEEAAILQTLDATG